MSRRRAVDHPVAHKEGIDHNAAKAALEGRCARKSAAEHAHTRVSLLWAGCWRDESDGRLVLVHEMDSARGSRHHVAVHTQAHEHTAPRARTTRRGNALHRVRCDVRAHHVNLAKVAAHWGSREVTAHQCDQRATAAWSGCRPERREARRGELAPALSPATAGTAQTSTDELRHTAWLVVSLKRQSRYERSAERDEKCAPISVTGVPPKTGPALGVTERTTAAAWYSKARCSVAAAAAAEPIVEATPSATTPGGRAGVTHRTRDREIHNAGDAPERPKWHANEASRDMSAPSTVSSVPPSSGPS
eukprot:scaffold142445_cov187-Phaeocystis_antarctica.AAC.2